MIGKRILVTGASGMLGQEVVRVFSEAGAEVLAFTREQFDVADPIASGKIIAGDFGSLDWVINCAAYTAVDRAEEEVDLAFSVNALGPSYLGRACAIANIPLVHYSTDYVFKGDAQVPYVESDPVDPVGVYGRSKREGEEAILASGASAHILRTSWLFGPAGPSFARTMFNRRDQDLRIVNDQTGTPTYAPYLAAATLKLIQAQAEPGIYHAAGSEVMTWYEFAERIQSNLPEAIGKRTPITTAEYPTPAKRPAYSALNSEKLNSLIGSMPSLDHALTDFIAKLEV